MRRSEPARRSGRARRSGLLKHLTAALLAAVLALQPVSTAFAAAPSASKNSEQAEYLNDLYGRYEDYRDGDYSYEKLTDSSNYIYCAWTDEINYITHAVEFGTGVSEDDGWWERTKKNAGVAVHNASAAVKAPFVWAGHYLTDTKLNEDAYVEYLTQLVAMHEKGFLETARQQADFTMSVNTGEEITEIGFKAIKTASAAKFFKGAKLKELLGADLFNELTGGLKKFMDADSILRAGAAEISDYAEAYTLALYANVHKERLSFLQAIYDNTDEKEQKALHNAAADLIDASNLRFASLLQLDSEKRMKDILKIVTNMDGLDLGKYMDSVSLYVSTCASDLIQKLLGVGKLGAFASSAVFKIGTNLGLIAAGFEIGGHIGRIFWGNDYESFRCMLAMDEIGNALSRAIPKYEAEYRSAKDDDSRYDALVRLVSAGEALCYVRLRGEYCVTEYARGQDDGPTDERLDEVYQNIAGELNKCYTALATVFPQKPEQVAVYFNLKHKAYDFNGWTFDSIVSVPEVYIEGNDDAAETITEWLSSELERLDDSESMKADIQEFGAGGPPSLYSSSSWDVTGADSAYATKQALSVVFHSSTYYAGAAHPMSAYFSYNFDTSTGKLLKLTDVLNADDTGKAKKELTALLAEQFDPALLQWMMTEDAGTVIDGHFMNPDNEDLRERRWYFSKEGFNVVFNQYEVGPYAAGSPTLTVPYSKLGGIIRDEYMPQELAGSASEGSVSVKKRAEVADDPAYNTREDLDIFGNMTASFYGAVAPGNVFEVSIHEDAILSCLRFYTNEMGDNDVVWLNVVDDIKSSWYDSDLLFLVTYWEKKADSEQMTKVEWKYKR